MVIWVTTNLSSLELYTTRNCAALIPCYPHDDHFPEHTAGVEVAVNKVLEVIILLFYLSILPHCATNKQISKVTTEKIY